jgi:DNA-directed RNA polymerase beta' subunit
MASSGDIRNSNVSKIIGIQFSIMSPEEILKGSVAEITNRETYVNNKPVIGGLFDPRMGPIDPGVICPTDGLDYMKCPGYFGHIKLARPVFYYQYLGTVLKILRCVCIKCSALRISKSANKQLTAMPADERWAHVFRIASKIKRCGEDTETGCGCLQPKRITMKAGLGKIYAEWDNVKGVLEETTAGAIAGSAAESDKDGSLSMKLTPEIVIKIFRRISDEDVEFMGFSPVFSRPDWMVCQVLAIPPPAVRPSVKMDGSQRSEDDITHIIVNIIKANTTLLDKINEGAPANVIDGWHMMLQYYVATQVNNNIPGCAPVAQRSGRPLKSIQERLNGKMGRVRGNLMGKRVDFSARSVITPDPNLSIRELGIPLKIAKNITKPVVVNDRNKKFLLRLVRAGPDEYPGSKILERKTGESISLRYADRANIMLNNGDIVHRHMMDGDAILFNRQPTLHRMSMMCHIARVMYQGDTFRMNVGCTKPYNADFDGDEMNLHMPQDDESEIELRHLAAVPYQLISPANNNSIIGVFQDSLIGSYLFTRENIKFTPREAMNLLAAYPRVNETLFKSGEDVSNFDVLSQILPPLTLKYKKKAFGEKNPNEDYATSNNVVEIRNGRMMRGQIDKSVLGGGGVGLIQRVCNDFGNIAAADFIDGLQNIITEYMKSHAYSVGISDLIANKTTNTQIVDVITKKKTEVKNLIDQVHLGIFENKTGKSNEAEFEAKVSNILNTATSEAGGIGTKSLNSSNRFIGLVLSGSKGSDLNISQMISCLGQQAIEGKRISYGFDSRTLPHFNKFDDGPLARGFIESSFISGLSPEELFFHAMGGRIGLIDTAVKSVTWETPIIVVENEVPKYVKIGEWIDAHLAVESTANKIQYMTEQNMEYLELTHPIKIVTMDYDGNVSWETITAVTRHDPGEKLFKIKTKAGRYVTVTANKSLLVWNEELQQFREKYTEEIKVGDFVPVAKNVCDYSSGGSDNVNAEAEFMRGKCAGAAVNVQIPEEAYVAGKEYIRGLLTAYIEPRVVRTSTGFELNFGSNVRLTEDVAFLCSRLNIHAEIHQSASVSASVSASLVIRGSSGKMVASLLGLSVDDDDVVAHGDDAVRTLNDVILDEIVEMTMVDPALHPKMYDLTIPTTLNFGLANGLQVRDTSQTGYIQRRLIKGMEDLKVEYDMTVRNGKQRIIQFTYGDDGIDTIKVENQSLPLVAMSLDEIYAHFHMPLDNSSETEQSSITAFTKTAYAKMKKEKATTTKKIHDLIDYMIEMRDLIIEQVFNRLDNKNVQMPVSFTHIINNVQAQQQINQNSMVDLTPIEAMDMISAAFRQLENIFYAPPTLLFKVMYYYYLSPKEILLVKRFNRSALTILLSVINLQYKRSIVAPGEMVGMVSAQSIGEPTTQLTLNTFHSAGVASKSNATRGVPRIEEILSLSENPKNPSITIYFKEDDEGTPERVQEFIPMIEHTKLSEVVETVEVCFDPDDLNTLVEQDRAVMSQYQEFEKLIEECVRDSVSVATTGVPDVPGGGGGGGGGGATGAAAAANASKSKWIIRIKIDAEAMLDKKLTMDDIHFAIKNSYGNEVSCAFSDYNDDHLVFRLRMENIAQSKKSGGGAGGNKQNPLDQSDHIYMIKSFQDQLLNNIVLRGVKGIKKVMVRKIKNTLVKSEGVYTKKDSWVLDTMGTNLVHMLGLDYIDTKRTVSNDIQEVYRVFGIEAARQAIFNELAEVFDDSPINYHHVSLLCDRMTVSSSMISIFRHGINSDDIGPLAKASFEETPEMFLKAARHAELDPMRGISANVMCGQEGYYGTSAFQVLVNMDEMMKQETVEYRHVDANEEIEDAFKANASVGLDTDKCGIPKLAIQSCVDNVKKVRLGKMDDDYDIGF